MCDHRLHDGGVLRVVAEAAHEGLVDLQHVHREPPQVRERRVAGAEVVDRQLHAERLEPPEGGDGDVDVVHEDALGDLEADVARVGAGALEGGGDQLDEVVLEELAGRRC